MFRKALILLGISLCSAFVHAQESEVSTIIPSSAPAFTILGISPTEISKPNSWNALQAAAYQNLVSNNGSSGALKNFALEFNPYWLSNHPKFTYQNYLDLKGFTLRNLNISIASGKAAYGKDSAQSLGFGFRLPIMVNQKKRALTAADLNKFISDMKEKTTDWQVGFVGYLAVFNGNLVKDLNDDILARLKMPPVGNNFWKKNSKEILRMMADTLQKTLAPISAETYQSQATVIATVVAEYFNNINKTNTQAITDSISHALRKVTDWEISGALSLAFPTNQFSYSSFSNMGIWSDYSFEIIQKARINGTAALRYVRKFRADSISASNNFDGIFRINYAADNKQRFQLSLWGVLRRISGGKADHVNGGILPVKPLSAWDNKYGIDISLRISDQMAVSYSLGKNYKNQQLLSVKSSNQLISLLNLFYSINTKVKKTGQDYTFRTF